MTSLAPDSVHLDAVTLALVALTLLLAACGNETPMDSWQGSTQDSAGITVVTNPDQPIWRGGAGWRVAEDLTIGAVDGDPDYLLGQIAGICVGSDGRIFVVDVGAASIRVYAPGGNFIEAFGESGSGPGELGATLGPCLMEPGDTLAIPDLQNFRVSRFAPDGTALSSTRFDLGDGIPLRWHISRTGQIAMQLRFGILDQSPMGTPDAIVWWTVDGSPGDTLLTVPVRAMTTLPSGQRRYTLLAAESLWQLAPDGGVMHASSDAYRITQRDSQGNAVRIISKTAQPVALTETDRDMIRQAVEDVFSARLIDMVMGGIHFPEHFPLFFQLRSGPRGSLWVQQVLKPSDLPADQLAQANFGPEDPEVFLANPRLRLGSPNWDVFDQHGRFLGVVTMPERFQPMRFVDDHIYGVWRDDMDVEYLKRLIIVVEGSSAGTDEH